MSAMSSNLARASLFVGICSLFAGCGSGDADFALPAWLRHAPGAELVRLDNGRTLPSRLVDSRTGIELILVAPVEFDMGTVQPIGHADEQPVHRVSLSKPYYLGRTEVTVGAWRTFVAATGDPSANAGGGRTISARKKWEVLPAASWRDPFPDFDFELRDDHPVCLVSWDDATRFCKHYGYRLPTEAEWENAARAGTGGGTRYWWGDAEADVKGRGNVLDTSTLAVFPGFGRGFAFDDGHVFVAPVASFEPNPMGFHDIVGNVAEWTHDAYKLDAYQGRGTGVTADPVIEAGDQGRVVRGGGWNGSSGAVRSGRRFNNKPTARMSIYGFRIVWQPEPK